MIRLFFLAVVASLMVGCKSTGSSAFATAHDQGAPGLRRACANGVGSACALVGAVATPTHRLSILQGLTGLDRARFTVMVPDDARLRYFVRDGEGSREVRGARRFGPSTDYAVDQLDAHGLRPGVDFELVVVGLKDDSLWDRRLFRALDPAKSHARIALVSATDDGKLGDARVMWPVVLGQNPDLLLLLGDNVYVDHAPAAQAWIKPDPATLWQRYVETRTELPLYFAPRLVPTLATWDDHDFAYNDADRTFAWRDQSRDTFLTFFPQNAPGAGFTRGPGIASWWSAFGVDFGLCDNRSFRTVNRAAGPQSHFGPEQEAWLTEHLAMTDRPVLLASGDQFFGGYHPFESFEGSHPENFKAVLEAWRRASKSPLVFLSGDRLVSEVIAVPEGALGYPTFEITSSGLHARTFAEAFALHPNPRRVVGAAGKLNFSVIEIMRAEKTLLRFSTQAFGRARELLYQKTLVVKR